MRTKGDIDESPGLENGRKEESHIGILFLGVDASESDGRRYQGHAALANLPLVRVIVLYQIGDQVEGSDDLLCLFKDIKNIIKSVVKQLMP